MIVRKIFEMSGPKGIVKVYYNSELREFCAKLSGYPESDYFTDDQTDAERTAEVMAGYAPR